MSLVELFSQKKTVIFNLIIENLFCVLTWFNES